MGRAGMTNVDVSGRIRQFILLIFITVIGMIVSVAFLGGGLHKPQQNSSQQIKTSATPAEASFSK